MIVHHSQWYDRAERSDSGQLCEFSLIGPHHPLPPPQVILACSQPPCAPCVRRFGSCRRQPVSYTPWSEGRQLIGAAARHRRPRAAAAKSRFLRFCRVCQAPGTPCAYRIARALRSAVPYTAWTKCRQRGGQLHGIGDSLLRSQSRAVSPRCMGAREKVKLRV